MAKAQSLCYILSLMNGNKCVIQGHVLLAHRVNYSELDWLRAYSHRARA